MRDRLHFLHNLRTTMIFLAVYHAGAYAGSNLLLMGRGAAGRGAAP